MPSKISITAKESQLFQGFQQAVYRLLCKQTASCLIACLEKWQDKMEIFYNLNEETFSQWNSQIIVIINLKIWRGSHSVEISWGHNVHTHTSNVYETVSNVPLSLCPQYTSVDSSIVSSMVPSSGSYTSLHPSVLHSTHNSSNSSSISHLANMPIMGSNISSTVCGIAGTSGLHSAASAALGLGSNGAIATSNLSAPRNTPLLSSTGTHNTPTLHTSDTRHSMCDSFYCYL